MEVDRKFKSMAIGGEGHKHGSWRLSQAWRLGGGSQG